MVHERIFSMGSRNEKLILDWMYKSTDMLHFLRNFSLAQDPEIEPNTYFRWGKRIRGTPHMQMSLGWSPQDPRIGWDI